MPGDAAGAGASAPTPLAATNRLWLTEPRRATSISSVTRARGDRFTLDRSLFAPTSHSYRHSQPHDTGVAWIEGGEKRILTSSFEDQGLLWHRLRGAIPTVGSKLNCQLDQERRLLTSRAHTAMHLVLHAMARPGPASTRPALVADPAVKGGGTFRLELAGPVAPTQLAAWLAQANQWVAANKRATVEHHPRELAAKVLEAQLFDPADPFPGPQDVLSCVRVDGVGALPCDGTHVEQTQRVGRIVFNQARTTGRRVTLVGKVL